MALLTARILPLGQLLQLGYFRPAAVQRDYQWDEFRGERLLTEIVEAMRATGAGRFLPEDADAARDGGSAEDEATDLEPDDLPGVSAQISENEAAPPKAIPGFFVGVMVLSPVGNGMYEIFDGLQRLTTLTIALSVLRDLIDDATLKARLNKHVSADSAFRLRHAGADATLSAMIQKSGEAGTLRQNRSRPATDSGRHIFDVARRLVLLFRRRSQQELAAISNFVLDQVLAGTVETGDQRLARHIFVASNLYGLPLQRDEVFKGQILALAPSPQAATEMESQWNEVRDLVGRRKEGEERGKFEEFLITFDAIWRRQPQGADCLGDLIDHLSTDTSKLPSFMRAMLSYAAGWRELESLLKTPTGGPIGNHIWRLSFFKWAEWKPLALHWLERHRAFPNNPKQFSKTRWRFAQLNRSCMVITLYEFGEERRSEMFLQALRMALRQRPVEPFSDNPRGPRLPLNFSNTVSTRIKAALLLPIEDYAVRRSLVLWYEATLWPKDLAPAHLSGGTVEHILPERPDLNSQWVKGFPDVGERYAAHNSLGNLALVDWSVNEELSNKDFVHKKPILESRGQYPKYKCLSDIRSIPSWTADVISERARVMAARIWSELDLREPK